MKLIRSFQAPTTVRTLSDGQVYVFKSGTSDSEDSSEEELDVMELRARGKELQQRKASREKAGEVVFLEREVRQDDNLNKLALQYGCKVADIKRVNNFIREQDLYALKSIKIPVKANSLLTETSEELRRPQSTGFLLVERLGSEDGTGGESAEDSKQIDQYFRGIDQKIKQAAQAAVSPSADYCVETPNWSPPGQKETSSGADWGIRWWNAIFVMLLIGVVLPVFYIVYVKTQKIEVASNTSNMTANDSRHGLEAGAPVHLRQEEYSAVARTLKPGTSIPSGG